MLPTDDIARWRVRVFSTLLPIVLVLGTSAALPSMALALRQVKAVGGSIRASNLAGGGLRRSDGFQTEVVCDRFAVRARSQQKTAVLLCRLRHQAFLMRTESLSLVNHRKERMA